jgi:L-threonylcarbamoyladenylate synthase
VDIEATLARAVAHLAVDGFVAYPTETVWGLGACADRSVAIDRLTRWKRRAADAPLAVLVSSPEASSVLGCEIDRHARQLMDAFWPGPLMIITPCRNRFASGVARGDGALGLRCSSHPVAHGLSLAVQAAGLGPLTSTSFNRTGATPAADLDAAMLAMRDSPGDDGDDLKEVDDGEQPFLVSAKGHDAGGLRPSSVVDCTGASPEILRVGAIDRALLEKVWKQ